MTDRHTREPVYVPPDDTMEYEGRVNALVLTKVGVGTPVEDKNGLEELVGEVPDDFSKELTQRKEGVQRIKSAADLVPLPRTSCRMTGLEVEEHNVEGQAKTNTKGQTREGMDESLTTRVDTKEQHHEGVSEDTATWDITAHAEEMLWMWG